jgi:hypothetical protein
MQPLYDAAKAVIDKWETGDLAEAVRNLAKVVEDFAPNPEDDAFVDAAREHADDDLEVDGMAFTSRADEGCWVSAWIWISDKEAGIEHRPA